MTGLLPAAAQERLLGRALARCLETEGLRVTVVGPRAYLGGAVASFQCKQRAARLVALLAGVREVVNQVRVVPRARRLDATLARELEAILIAGKEVGALSVRVSDGIVHLEGEVCSLARRYDLEAAAWSVPGVLDVMNRLVVTSADAGDELEAGCQMAEALECCLFLEPGSVRVGYGDGVATLSGAVPSLDHREAAEELLRWHCQVRQVVNQLSVAPTASPRRWGAVGNGGSHSRK